MALNGFVNYQFGGPIPGPIPGPSPIVEYPYQQFPVISTIEQAEYNDGSVYPFVKINYMFILEYLDNVLINQQRRSNIVDRFSSLDAGLDLNLFNFFNGSPYGFCTWKQLAWHNGVPITFGIARSGEFIHFNDNRERVTDFLLSPIGDSDFPVIGSFSLFDPDSIDVLVTGEIDTKTSFGNEIWKIPDEDVMSAIGTNVSISNSFLPFKSLVSVPKAGWKTLNSKVLSQVLEYRGNPELVLRNKEEIKQQKYGNASVKSVFVGEKIYPSRDNSLVYYTRERGRLLDRPYWRWIDYDKSFDDRLVFWRKNSGEQILNFGENPVENSQLVSMDFSAVADGDSWNRWPLVTRVDSSVYDLNLHISSKHEAGELATSPFNDVATDQEQTTIGSNTLMYTVLGDMSEAMTNCVPKLSGLDEQFELKYHLPLQSQKDVWYGTYEKFLEDVRPLSKGFSTLPEYRVSSYMKEGINSSDTDKLELVGYNGNTSDFSFESLDDTFSERLVVGSKLITVNKFKDELFGLVKPRSIKFDVEVIKKIHPYFGFFPVDRSVQIGNLLKESYYNCIFGLETYTNPTVVPVDEFKWQSFLYHLMSPGVFYNSIKSAVGVGLPVFTGGVGGQSFPVYSWYKEEFFGPVPHEEFFMRCVMSNPKFYLPFETLFNLPKNILMNTYSSLFASRDMNNIMFAPLIWHMFPDSSNYNLHDLNFFFKKENYKPLFDLANNNFFAESANLFLKDGLAAFYSKPETQFKEMVGGSVYYMDVVLKNKNCVICEGYSQEAYLNQNTYVEEFDGAGVDDASFSGVFASGYDSVSVKITVEGGAGPDSFQYSVNGGSYGNETLITALTPLAIGTSGISVTFDSENGHTLNDVWDYFVQGDLALSQRGSIYGVPLSMDSNLEEEIESPDHLQREYDVRDPAYGPFCPPYFYAPAVARISFDPQEADPTLAVGQSKKFSLAEILKHSEIRTIKHTNTGGQILRGTNEYFAPPGADNEINDFNGLYHEYDWYFGLYDHESDVYSGSGEVSPVLGSTLLQTGFMNIMQSVDLFNKKLVTGSSFVDNKVPALSLVEKEIKSQKEYVWCINTKWESPVLQFNKHSTSTYDNTGSSAIEWPGRARGMWMDYGEEPEAEDGLFLEIRESFPSKKLQNKVHKTFLASLEIGPDLGEKYNDTLSAIMEDDAREENDVVEDEGGTLSYFVPKKKVESLIDVCGFSVGEKKLGVVADKKEVEEAIVILPFYRENNELKFFEIDREILEKQIDSKKKNGYAHKTVYNDELEDTSITSLIKKMQDFVLPPWLDFIKNKQAAPVVMYIVDFSTEMSKNDLIDMWQNVLSPSFEGVEVETKQISHGWEEYELFHGKELPKETEFAVFKIKKKAEWNYNAIKPNYNSDEEFVFEIINQKGEWETKRVDYNFNWPYDFFSLIEYGKVNCSFEFVGV